MKRNTAIVIGGSMAGLMAARALSNHFTKVIVLERDPLIDNEHPRKGVPQGHHVHVLMAGGRNIIEHYFPGIVDEMVRDGIARLAWEDIRWYQSGSWKTCIPTGLIYYPQARVTLENRVCAWLRQQSRVEIHSESNVESLIYDSTRQSVTGVRLLQSGKQFDLYADLVVDAGGRGSRILKWLSELGYQAPPKETTPIDLVYVSRIYQKTTEARDWQGMACYPLPNGPRGAILLPLDSERWILSLFGYLGEHPTTDPDSTLLFLKDLPILDLYNTVSKAKALSNPVKYEYPQQLRQRYDRLKDFPNGLLVIGDAMCSFDPIFGQGMTVASLEAHVLDQILASAKDPRALRKKFFTTSQRIIEIPWLIAKSESLRYKNMPGKRSLLIRILQWYTGYVFALSAESVEAYRAFLDVMHSLADPMALLRPAVLGRVLSQALTGQKPNQPSV
jgi:2-polyprenyl-6-methoxyphenol hydroxylase-like FAD-dependent oxidoreductase